MSSNPVLKLDWCSHAAAKYAVEKWHYSGTLPVGKSVKTGVWEDGQFIGCVIFAYGANSNIGKPFGLAQQEICELVRVALAPHGNTVTRIVSVAIKFLQKLCAGIRAIVSYADTSQGHHGGIYQGGNWSFLGTSPGTTEYLLNGRWCHAMQIQTYIRSGKVSGYKGLPKQQSGSKYKYLMPLDAAMRAQILPLAKPYPKRTRAGGDTLDTPANHAGEGGAIPTPALHIPIPAKG